MKKIIDYLREWGWAIYLVCSLYVLGFDIYRIEFWGIHIPMILLISIHDSFIRKECLGKQKNTECN